jgi:lipoprotein NlpD
MALSGCARTRYVSDVPEPAGVSVPEAHAVAARPSSTYTVQPGDSLYSIAFGANMDWRDIAAHNGIHTPYTIYPGQVLQLAESMEDLNPVAATLPNPVAAVPATSSLPLPLPDPQPSAAPSTAESVQAASPAAPAPRAVPAPAEPVPVVKSDKTPILVLARPVRPGAWLWPSDGTLSARFSAAAQPHKGVDFSGNTGDAVLAAKGGSVVYAGSGVRGYGNLLIVKHDASFLSAYAHNSRLLVKEGDMVDAGQKIAEMGNSGTDRIHLHFEVRRQGRPIDPLTVLPKR